MRFCRVPRTRLLLPHLEGQGAHYPIAPCLHQMASRSKVAVDEGVSRQEALHLTLAAPGRPMRVLRAIVQVSALTALDIWQKLALGYAVTLQFVGDENARRVLEPLQETLEEALRRSGITAGLYQNVKHVAVLINGAPEIMLFPLDPSEDRVQMPLVTGFRSAPTKILREAHPKLQESPRGALVGDKDAALGWE
jgi:hypothetical protein